MATISADPAAIFAEYVDLPAPGHPLDLTLVPAHGGVYALSDERGGIIQTISTQNLRRTVAVRLQGADDASRPRSANLREVARRLWWTPSFSVFESTLIYLDVSRRLMPDTYRKHLGFAPAWFASIQPERPLPRWRADALAFQPDAVEFGPFDRRRHCDEFIAILEDLFDLCREHHILDRTPHGTACTYYEMDRCPAPCDGTIPLAQYHAMIRASLRFATGETGERFGELETVMRRAAETREYARAARLKELLQRARDFLKRHALACARVDNFRLLIIQREGRRSQVKPFFVDRGTVEAGAPVQLSRLSNVAREWVERLHRPREIESTDARRRSECVWLVSHFIAKGDKAPGLYLRPDETPTADNLMDAVNKKFARRNDCASDKPPKPK